MSAFRHLELEFCHIGPPMKSTMQFQYPLKISCRSDICRQREITILLFCQFGWKMPHHAPFFFFVGFVPLKISVAIKTPKRHILGWFHIFELLHVKSVIGSFMKAMTRKKVDPGKIDYISPISPEAPLHQFLPN